MQTPAKLLSYAALAVTILPSVLFFAGAIGHDATKWATLAGTALWFIATPLWVGRKTAADAA